MTQSITLSRRAICTGGFLAVGAAAMPCGALAKIAPAPLSVPLHLRGVSFGSRAVLRTSGTVSVETPTATHRRWGFVEVSDVSWSMRDGQVIEQRRGFMQVNGKNISTGPASEILCADEHLATISNARGTTRLLVAAATLAPSVVWDILDDPIASALPKGLSEYRVFKTTEDDNVRDVYWTLRSPWLPALGAAQPHTRLIWRGQGQLKPAAAFV